MASASQHKNCDGLFAFYLAVGWCVRGYLHASILTISASGAVPLPMLPPFWRAIGPYLPPGAGTWTARSIADCRTRVLATCR